MKPGLCLCSLPSCLAQTRAACSPRNTLCLFPREAALFLTFTKTLYRLAQVPLAQSLYPQLVLVQLLSHVRLFVTPWTAACQASLSITNSWRLLKLMSIESVMLSNHLIFRYPLLLPPSIFPSIRSFLLFLSCLPIWHKVLACLESFKNTYDKVTLIPSSFSHVIA